MAPAFRGRLSVSVAAIFVLFLSSCAPTQELNLEQDVSVEDTPTPEPQAPPELTLSLPSSCADLLPQTMVNQLGSTGVELLRGRGSPSAEPVYLDGQSPEELVGGLSCLYGLPGAEELAVSIVLSVAPVDPAGRPQIISDLLAQNLNIGQTLDAKGLTYWIWGDDSVRSALHNELYADAWYSALVQPGGRPAYDQAVALVEAMRKSTTQ